MSNCTHMKKDQLEVCIYPSREEMGRAAARDAAALIEALLAEKEELNILFAAAPSQNEFLEAVQQCPHIDWTRINAFHMDEYIGLDETHPAGFRNFLRQRIFSKVPFKSVNYLNGNAEDPAEEAARYSALLREHPLDICFCGIGENGHLAFNDPPVANFRDPVLAKVVELDQVCRLQQVHDGCFQALDEVPTHALTITIPGMMCARHILCVVPAPTKAEAVFNTVNAPISTQCPATIMRTHTSAKLYLDADSSAKLK